MKKSTYILVFLFGFTSHFLSAQDVEQLAKARKADPITVSGGLSVSSGASHAYGMTSQRPPFYWMLRGNLNFNFFGLISAPVSIAYSPQGNTFDYPFQRLQPFNQFGISPSYKSITVHIGYRSMNLSSYSLSGNTFNGVGVEWKPKTSPWSAAAMYGQLAKAVNDTTLLNRAGVTLYNRNGYGGKIGYKNKTGEVNFIFFRAKDKEDTYPFPEGLIEDITPQENLVTGIKIQQRIIKKVNVKVEYTRSAFTDNTLSATTETGALLYNNTGSFFTPRQSTSYSGALDAVIAWNPKPIGINIAYKRIDPDYQTLGIPFLNNDIEVSSLGLTKRFLKNKINASGNVGLQRNNLDNTQLDKTMRLANSLNVNYNISKKVSTSWAYANYTTNTTKVTIEELDSLSYFQVTNNLNGTLNVKIGQQDKLAQALSASASFQKADDLNDNNSDVRNYGIGYNLSHKKSTLRASMRLNIIQTFSALQNRNGFGPTLSVSRSFFDKKVNTRFSINGNRYYSEGTPLNMTTSSRISISFSPKTAHSFSLNGSWLHRNNFEDGTYSGEMQVSFAYHYKFSKDKMIRLRKADVVEDKEVSPQPKSDEK